MKPQLKKLHSLLLDIWIAYHIDRQISGWQALRHAAINLWLLVKGGLG